MDANGPNSQDGSSRRSDVTNDCPLTEAEQWRNIVIFLLNKCCIYSSAPVLYVGLVQAALLERLETSKETANLPGSLYFAMTPIPMVIAWCFSSVRHLRPVLVGCYLTIAASGACVMATLLTPTPEWLAAILTACGLPGNWVILATIIHAMIAGGAGYTVETYQWEVLARGVSQSRRGTAFGLAYGIGPLLGLFSSIATQNVLDGALGYQFPWNFGILFGATLPVMMIPAVLSSGYVVVEGGVETPRPPFLKAIFGGFGVFLRNRTLLIVALAYILVTSGFNIINNMTLFTQEAVGESAEQLVGYQQALRFGFKSLAGFALGWLLVKAGPKACLVATAGLCLASVVWILNVPGLAFLVAFGLIGAGELNGWYYPNYIVLASNKADVRRNAALSSILNMPSAFVGIYYGFLADRYGLRASFYVASAILAAAILVVATGVPSRPVPEEETRKN